MTNTVEVITSVQRRQLDGTDQTGNIVLIKSGDL